MNKPLVSVIIPTYKRERELIRAINSVIKQTYKEIEILIVDDNNDEYFSEKVKQIVQKYSSVRYIKNRGISGGSGARNEGVKYSNGEFISFLDDDDEYFENKIERQYMCYEKKKECYENLTLIYCYSVAINNQKKIVGHYKKDFEGTPLKESMKECIASTSLWFVKKDAFINAGGFIDVESKQDSFTMINLLYKNCQIARIPEELVYYYEYEGNKISGTNEKSIRGYISLKKFCIELATKIQDINLKNEIEEIYAYKLISLYLINQKKELAEKEFENIKKIKNKNKVKFVKTYIKIKNRYLYNLFINAKKKKIFG